MPPRKSNASNVAVNGEETTPAKEPKEPKEKSDGINIEELSLPRTMVQRLAKGVLPPNTQIQKDAITAMSKGATVFVNHIANAANEITLQSSRRTIAPQHVLEALATCEYGDFLPRVEAELKKFNEIATGKRNEYRRKIKEKESATKAPDEEEGEEDGNGERAAKRVRRENSDDSTVGDHIPENIEAGPDSKLSVMDDELGDAYHVDEDRDQDIQDEAASLEEDDEEVDDEEQNEDDGSETGGSDDGGGSGPDMMDRLRAIQDGLSSGVESGSDESE